MTMDSTNVSDLADLRDRLIKTADTFSTGSPYHKFFFGLAEALEGLRQDIERGYIPDKKHFNEILDVLDEALKK